MNEVDALDEILVQIGDFGSKQVFAIFQICCIIVPISAAHVAYVFTAMDSDYRCYVPKCDTPTSQFKEDWVKNAIPFTSSNSPEQCEMYAAVPNLTLNKENCPATWFDQHRTISCSSYIFKDDEHYIGRQFNILCPENAWKLSLVGSINTAGLFLGLILAGIISDKAGRKFVILVGTCVNGIIGVIKTFSPNLIWIYIFEFLEAMSAAGVFVSAMILGIELVTPKNRSSITGVFFIAYAIGEVFLGVVAWLFKDWRMIIYVIYGPSILAIFLYWSIPESLRWYLSIGEIEKPKEILRSFAKSNSKQISDVSFERLNSMTGELKNKNETVSFMELLKSGTLICRLIICVFLWITCAFVYYGLIMNSVHISDNAYMDFIYISIAEILGYFCVSFLVVDRIGRRISLSGSYFLTAVSCAAFILIGEGQDWLHTLVYCIGKFGSTGAFYVVFAITSELFPTPLRNTAMGTCSMLGRIGSMTSPQTPFLSTIWQPLPLTLFAVMAAIAGILTLFLPETLNLKLPDTIVASEQIGKKETGLENCNSVENLR